MSADPIYDLSSVELPRLTGAGLRLFAEALEAPLSGPLLADRLIKDGGVARFRAAAITGTPLFHPPVTGASSGPPLPPLDAISAEAPAHFPFRRIRDFARAYRTGRATPSDVAERIIEEVGRLDSGPDRLGLFIAFDPAVLRADAARATERLARGAALGPLDGVPIGVKDELDQHPYPTTGGTRFLGRSPASEDATSVARLRAQGALLLGKLNMNEIGINPCGANEHHGLVRNPYRVAHDTGGSSSGSAAAVAAGFCPAALGADGGGSIRIPAALCGVLGLKPTFSRVSEHGAATICWSVAHVGPLGASAEDVALVYAAIAGPDPRDATSLTQPPPTLDRFGDPAIAGLRIGLYRPWFDHAAPAVVRAADALLTALVERGAQLREITLPGLEQIRVAHAITILSEMARAMDDHRLSASSFGLSTRINLHLGRLFTSRDYVQAQRVRAHALGTFARAFSEVDVIATPSTAITAPKIPVKERTQGWSDLSAVTEVMRFAVPPNFTGHPAISVPAGYDEQDLPIGLQLIGRSFEEHVILRVAHAAEQIVARRVPPVYVPLLP